MYDEFDDTQNNKNIKQEKVFKAVILLVLKYVYNLHLIVNGFSKFSQYGTLY